MDKPEEFEKKAKIMLDENLDDLSPDISRRLQQARYAALEKASANDTSYWSFFPQATTAVFTVAIVTMSMFFYITYEGTNGTTLVMETESETEIEMLMANESLELLEDLDFMQWLVETEEYAS